MNNKRSIIGGILLWLGLCVFGVWVQNHYNLLRYIFFLRVPIFVGLLLVLLPIISINLLPAMLKNLFVLRNKWQLMLVIFCTMLTGIITISVFNVILTNAHLRFPVDEISSIPENWVIIIAILLALPIIVTSLYFSWKEINNIRDYLSGIVFGGGLTIILFVASHFLPDLLESNNTVKKIYLSIIYILPSEVRKGYIYDNGEIAPRIISLIALSLLILVVYVWGYHTLEPRPKPNRFETPALFYLTFILGIMVLLLGGMSFFLDLSRVPVLLLFLLISFSSYKIFGVDHYYQMYKPQSNTAKPSPEKWKEAVKNRLQKNEGYSEILVVVCASGGGIQAAGWTTQVLTGLQEIKEIGTKFTKAIGWISAVSGGSVGTMFYLDRFDDKYGYPENNELEKIFISATEDSLDATGWGFAYPDLLRFIGLPFLVSNNEVSNNQGDNTIPQDRGTAIEIDWKGEMKSPNTCLYNWYDKIETGILPIPIFNATLVEDGQRFLISPMTFQASFVYKCKDFNTLYPEYTIDVTTAARLSATFPYISPVCRPSEKTKYNYHVADGGYFDNFGVTTSIQLLDELLESDESNQIKKVVFLQINAFPENKEKDSEKGASGWQMEVFGSIQALLNVRSSTQTAGNDLNIRLLSEKYKCGDANHESDIEVLVNKWCEKGIEIKHIPITFPSDPQFKPPLSWQLTQQQKDHIKEAWQEIKNNQNEDGVIPQIKKIFSEDV
ncbi:MAG: hypothetical protein QNJ47_04625 [Nostocaceae cyanobacterium]|nr:hypothetical protein [Nostocaceae cyanobacterium]